MILTAQETETAGRRLVDLLAPHFDTGQERTLSDSPIDVEAVIPSTRGWPPTRRGSYRTHRPRGEYRHLIRLTADRPLNSTLVSAVAHELCHAAQAERYDPENIHAFFLCAYPSETDRAGSYRANRFEQEARRGAARLTAWTLEKLEDDIDLAELCGLEWRTA